MMRWRLPLVVVCLATLALLDGMAAELRGHWRERSLKGVPTSPYVEYYEWNAFLTPAGASTNRMCRTGACAGTLTHDGAYIFLSVPDGAATIYVDQPNFFAAPRVKPVALNGTTYLDTEPNCDYHVAFGSDMGRWGDSPWDWYSGTWYQTFVATGTGVNRVNFKLAAPVELVYVAIHRSNGGAVSGWPRVGPEKAIGAGCQNCDVWVAWRHGEVPTTPGESYAVSFRPQTGSIGFFTHRDSRGQAYAQGTAYKGDAAQAYDLYAMVFSDNDGTILTYQLDSSNIGEGTEWAGAWAQSFTARGTSLAAVGLFAQNPADPTWPATVLIFDGISGGQQGNQVGPTKRLADAGWYGPGTGFGGMSYQRGEVPLVPGRQYLIVYSPYDYNGGGFNPLRRPGGNVLPDGTSYIGRSGTWEEKTFDLSMTIMEYVDVTPSATPTPSLTPTPSRTPTRTPTPTMTPIRHRSVIELR